MTPEWLSGTTIRPQSSWNWATSSRLLHPFLQEEQMTAGFALWVSALMADTLPVLQMTGWFASGALRKGLLWRSPRSLMASAVPSLLKEVSLLLGLVMVACTSGSVLVALPVSSTCAEWLFVEWWAPSRWRRWPFLHYSVTTWPTKSSNPWHWLIWLHLSWQHTEKPLKHLFSEQLFIKLWTI